MLILKSGNQAFKHQVGRKTFKYTVGYCTHLLKNVLKFLMNKRKLDLLH